MTENFNPEDILAYTTEIVASHASHNTVDAKELPELIKNVYNALAALGGNKPEVKEEEKLIPAVPVSQSVFPDYIICLEDGKKLKTLKRHLSSAYGMGIEEYKARWNLPADYPVVAPAYADRRSALAKQIGLGRKKK